MRSRDALKHTGTKPPAALQRIPTECVTSYAFRVDGRVSASDMSFMTNTLAIAFDAHLKPIDLLILIRQLDPTDLLRLDDTTSIRRRLASIHRVDRFVLVTASDTATPLTNLLSTLTPVSYHHFDLSDVGHAWALLGTQPAARLPGHKL